MSKTRACTGTPRSTHKQRQIYLETKSPKYFDEMKAIIVVDAIDAFPDYSITFHVYKDASDLHLGDEIIQRDKPIAYYIKKITPAQQNYTTTEKELLASVQTFKEYSKILTGAQIILYTDHKNLTFKTFSVQRILRWRLFLDQFDCQIKLI